MKPLLHEKTIADAVWMIAAAGSVVLFFLHRPASYGFLLGGLMGGLTFRLLIIDVKTGLGGANPERKAFFGYVKRLFLYGAAMVIGLRNPAISFPAVIAGLLMPQLIILVSAAISRRKSHGT